MSQESRGPRERGAGFQHEIMLIDDDEQAREEFRLILERNGYLVTPCASGRKALGLLGAGHRPDLILLDLLMPEMNGWEFRIEQRRQPSWSSIPVIVLSADVSAKAEAIDAHAYLSKPFSSQALLDTLGRVLDELESERFKARASELDRLSSLGALAGGLAHEINNPLSFVIGNLELAERQASELGARLQGADAFSMVGLLQVLSRAQRGAERIAAVVRGVSLFAEADSGSQIAIDVHEVLESALQVAANEIRHCARLDRNYGPIGSVRGNRAKLGQVFLNLLLNAVRAVREAATSQQHVIRVDTSTDASGHVVVSISDTGRGIPPALQARIFDPFFMTRRSWGGLGLAVSRELVESMGGTIELESDVDRGSTFRISLPSHGKSRRGSAARSLVANRDDVSDQRARVLVVDDEPLMCEMLSAVLQGKYDVATFTDPRAALASMLEGAFDVVLCDLMMPDLTGMDVYAALEKERPALCERMIFISGGAFTDRAREFLATTRRPQIKKPFRREELIEAIEHQLRVKH